MLSRWQSTTVPKKTVRVMPPASKVNTMDHNTNINCLCILFDIYKQSRNAKARLRIRQAMYIHGIVDAVLSERVDLLPEASLTSR